MKVIFSETAWSEYLDWQKKDKQMVKKINNLIEDVQRNGFSKGTGKPEALKYRKAWSRRINNEHRLVYIGDENQNLVILSCNGHYKT